MTEHKFTDDEIIRALECCVSSTTNEACDGCPLNTEEGCETHSHLLESLALDLINRQKAEIERLISRVSVLAEIEKDYALKYGDDFDVSIVKKQIKAEAIKEFAQRLKAEKAYSTERHENIVPVAVIDWIVKEMTEGES